MSWTRAMDPVLAEPVVTGGPAPSKRAALELAPALGVAPRTATALVTLARRCEDSLPGSVDALAEGTMTLPQLQVVEQVTRLLPPSTASAVETMAIRAAASTTPGQLRSRAEAAAASRDPEFTAKAAADGVARRDVALVASPLPGCRRLLLDLPHLAAVGAWNALNGAAVAARTNGQPDGTPEGRTLPQLRADLASGLLTGVATADLDPTGDVPEVVIPSGAALTRFAEVHVIVSADDLTGSAEPTHDETTHDETLHDEPRPTGGGTARIPGSGPLDVDTTRELARTAPLRRLVADPTTGALVHRGTRTARAGQAGVDKALQRLAEEPVTAPDDLSTTAYRPGRRLRRFVVSRDQSCLGPACHHPAWRTQVDHTVNHGERGPDGTLGTTSHDNTGSLCEPVHDAKTHHHWQLTRSAPGLFTWTSPTGRAYEVEVPRLLTGPLSVRAEPP